jgi:hypothetical protein
MMDLLYMSLDKQNVSCIYKDIMRTIPQHVFFKENENVGQRTLYAVLKCVALCQQELGYVQGMSYLAATLLTY